MGCCSSTLNMTLLDTVLLPWNVSDSQRIAHQISTISSTHLQRSEKCKNICCEILTPTSTDSDQFEYDNTQSVCMRRSRYNLRPLPMNVSESSFSINIQGTNIPIAAFITQAQSELHY